LHNRNRYSQFFLRRTRKDARFEAIDMNHRLQAPRRRDFLGILLLVLFAFGAAGCVQPIAPAGDAPSAATDGATDAAADAAREPLPTETHNGIPVGFTAEGFPFRGDPNAPVTMVEYSDFECPFCIRHFVQTEPAIDDAYVRDGKLRVIFRDFPIVELHPNAPAAHIASLCVAEQGAAKYWEMHDLIFRTQSEWGNSPDPGQVFARLAEDAGADLEAYDACIADNEFQAWIDAALEEGRAAGVSGTPSFNLIAEDGSEYLLVGAQPFEQFALYIDALVAGEQPPVAAEPEQPEGSAEIPFWATAEGWEADPDRPGYNVAGDQYRGDLDAKVTVIEFSDFECPFCKQHEQETQPVLDEKFVETGDILWVFKHFPLSIHAQAPAAGAAAECGAAQGKFWEMYKALFESQGTWSVSDPNPIFVELAGELGLDTAAFEACLADPASAEAVQSDMNEGAPFVQGTPTFIVLFNGEGRIIPGALPADRFTQVLQEIVDGAQ
jgi:protein-disulfide isomerase